MPPRDCVKEVERLLGGETMTRYPSPAARLLLAMSQGHARLSTLVCAAASLVLEDDVGDRERSRGLQLLANACADLTPARDGWVDNVAKFVRGSIAEGVWGVVEDAAKQCPNEVQQEVASVLHLAGVRDPRQTSPSPPPPTKNIPASQGPIIVSPFPQPFPPSGGGKTFHPTGKKAP